MGIELINLSNETKAYLNNLTRSIERLSHQAKPPFVELPTSCGSIYVRADRVDSVTDECDGVYLTINGNYGYKVKLTYNEVVARLNEALGIKGTQGGGKV